MTDTSGRAPKNLPGQATSVDRSRLESESGRDLSAERSPMRGRSSAVPLLTTKLSAPQPRSGLVARSHLVERLTAALDRKLTLVSAPAGFGKTTLLSEWIAGCSRPVAWLSLDPSDNDPARFLTYLVAALQRVGASIGHDVATLPIQGGALDEPLTVLLNQLNQAESLILVLDDYHLITAEAVHQGLTFLLEHLPAHVHLAIASRADPPLPLARLRVRSQLSEVRARDLEFTVEEAHAFLSQTMGLELDLGASTVLQGRTEGWVAGLQLAGLSLQGREDVGEFVTAFAGTNRHILDYLVEEVLSRQSEEVQSFLLRTSVLRHMTGPLCDVVAKTEDQVDSQALLATLEVANLFTVPLDDERRWYRYHHLFADCLQAQLRRTNPELLPALHRRAAQWYASNGRQADAVDHALQANDLDYAARLIQEVALDLLARSEHATVRRWLEALPTELVESHPALCVFYGWILLEAFEVAAKQWLDRPDEGDLPRHLQFLRAALLARLSWLHGEPGQAGPIAGEVGGDQGPFQDTEVPDSRVRAYLTLYASAQIAEALRLQGLLRQAIQTYRDALRRVQDIDPDARMLAALSFSEMGLGRLLYEQNDLDAAEQHMTRAIELARQGRNEQYESWVYMLMPPVIQAQGRGPEALEMVDRAERSARRRGLEAEILWCAAQRARLACIQGDRDVVAQWTAAYRPSVDREGAEATPLGYFEQFADATHARALLALGRSDESVRLVERLLERSEASGQTGSTIELLVLAAEAWAARGNRSQALYALERALTLAEPEGYVRVFVDQGEPLAALLLAGRQQVSGVSQAYIQRLLEALTSSAGETQLGQPQPLVEPLTARELDVLRLLAIGLHNRDIAERLVVSIGTVKRHTGNIYGKLSVDNRTQAILRAQELGLL